MKMTTPKDAFSLKPVMFDEESVAELFALTNMEQIDKEVSSSDKERWDVTLLLIECSIIIVCLGVIWCYPARKTWQYLSKISANRVKFFLVDEESHRPWCQIHGVIVGTPVTLVFCGGKQMLFARGESVQDKLFGLLNPNQIDQLISATFAAIDMKVLHTNIKVRLQADEIHIAF